MSDDHDADAAGRDDVEDVPEPDERPHPDDHDPDEDDDDIKGGTDDVAGDGEGLNDDDTEDPDTSPEQ